MYDEENRRYIGKNKTIYFTYQEHQILRYLIKNKNRVVRYEELMEIGYKNTYLGITQHINRIRKKLNGELKIKTRTSLGYYI